ncbi:MAG: YicC family protein [Proteobacteria bacterium]|nr:MAG: YicC family protein [Pseudomonadota bacterium]
MPVLNFDQGLFDLMLKRSLAALSKHNLVHKENRNEIELVLALELLRRNEIIELAEPDALSIDVAERQLLFKALESAAVQLCKMREREGSHIGKELAARSASIRGLTAKISRIAAKSSDRYREILSARLAKLDKEIKVDADRLASELAIFAERVDISEELSRLLSHLKQFDSALKSAPEGKKFDFLAQEMGRELNTINSKAQDSAIQSLVIEAKLELEKVREQIQNIE